MFEDEESCGCVSPLLYFTLGSQAALSFPHQPDFVQERRSFEGLSYLLKMLV